MKYIEDNPSIVAETISLQVAFHQPVCKLCADVVLLSLQKKKMKQGSEGREQMRRGEGHERDG